MPTDTDKRLHSWLEARGFPAESLERLGGDVSPRVYYRVHRVDGRRSILATYPAATTSVAERFERTTTILQAAGVAVPRIEASDRAAGLILLEDAGPQTLYEIRARGWPALMPYLERAVEIAGRIACLDPAEIADLNPRLDAELLREELRKTFRELLEPRGLAGQGRFRDRFEASLDELCERLGAAPPAPCHRDFMARNLLPGAAPPEVTVIDHQDLRLGPPCYDLASLLNDSLFPPPEREAALLERAGLSGGDLDAYHRAAAQRGLKAAGTFAGFARRGFDTHLPLIPPTLDRALGHLGSLPEIRALAPRLRELWRDV